MSDKKIKVTINQMGEAVVDAQGFDGQGCEDATKNIEKALAGAAQDVDKVMKPEWSNPATEEQDQGQAIGFN